MAEGPNDTFDSSSSGEFVQEQIDDAISENVRPSIRNTPKPVDGRVFEPAKTGSGNYTVVGDFRNYGGGVWLFKENPYPLTLSTVSQSPFNSFATLGTRTSTLSGDNNNLANTNQPMLGWGVMSAFLSAPTVTTTVYADFYISGDKFGRYHLNQPAVKRHLEVGGTTLRNDYTVENTFQTTFQITPGQTAVVTHALRRQAGFPGIKGRFGTGTGYTTTGIWNSRADGGGFDAGHVTLDTRHEIRGVLSVAGGPVSFSSAFFAPTLKYGYVTDTVGGTVAYLTSIVTKEEYFTTLGV